MKLIKTNLVQAQEDIQEMNELVAILESYRNKIINSMAVPYIILGEVFVNSPTVFQSKPTMIEIDVTKTPNIPQSPTTHYLNDGVFSYVNSVTTQKDIQ